MKLLNEGVNINLIYIYYCNRCLIISKAVELTRRSLQNKEERLMWISYLFFYNSAAYIAGRKILEFDMIYFH